MDETAIPLVILSGPVGVGKTSVGHEVSAQLEDNSVPHTFIDLDGLAQTYPRPADDQFGNALALKNLKTVWANARDAGALNLVIARVVETAADVDAIAQVVPDAQTVVFQLSAGDEVLVERVGGRELGSGHDWHVNRAIELAQSLSATGPCDYSIATDGRTVAEIAGEIISMVDWCSG